VDNKHVKIKEVIKEYASARKNFKILKEEYVEYLGGNDNYIGIIGEYWSKVFLENLDSNKNMYVGVIQKKGSKTRNDSSKWIDFVIKDKEQAEDILESISVKTIFEGKDLESGEINYKDKPKDGSICSVIIIKLDEDELLPLQLLYINNLDENLLNGTYVNYKSNWNKTDEDKRKLKFRYYNNKSQKGFDSALSQFIYKYNPDDEKFEK